MYGTSSGQLYAARDLWETGGFHSTSPTSISWQRQRLGQSLRGWKNLVARAIDAGTPFTHYSYAGSLDQLPEQWAEKYNKATGALVDKVGIRGLAIWSDSLPNPIPSVVLQNRCLGKFISQALNAQRSVSGLTVLGEIRETLHMLRHPIEGISRGVSRYLNDVTKRCQVASGGRRFKLSGPTKRAKILNDVVAGTWLEYVFGWIPLFSDIDGIFDAVQNRKINTYPPTKQIHASVTDDSMFNSETSFNFSWITDHRVILSGAVRYTVKYKGAVKVNLPSAMDNFQRDAGFTLRDVIPSIWEIIPWSFFVDYFVNVQAILDSYSIARSDFAWVSKILYSEFDGHITTKFGNYTAAITGVDPNFYRVVYSPKIAGSGTRWMRYYNRSTPGSLVPTLMFTLPPINSRKWANISALTSQVLASGKTVRSLVPTK